MDINTNPVKVSIVEGAKFHANSHPYKVEIEGGGDFATKDYVNEKIAESKEGTGRIVDELPDVGEPGVVYFILKEESLEGDVYDEWMWLEKEGQSSWEHIGTTNDVTITLYDSTGQNTDGAMTQKAASDSFGRRIKTSGTSVGSGLKSVYFYLTNASGDAIDYSNSQHFGVDMNSGLDFAYSSSQNGFYYVKGFAFTGATSQDNGKMGMVPVPTTSDVDKYLKGDGTWGIVDIEKTVSEADYDPVTNRLILWNLGAGVYKIVSNNSADYLAGTIHNGSGGDRNLRVGGLIVVNEIGGASATPLHKWILYPEWAASYGIASAVVDASGTLEGYSNGLLLGTSDVINNLTSTSSLKPLSANQGRLLNNNKQDKLTAGTGISIDANNVISTTYSVFTPNEWSALWS